MPDGIEVLVEDGTAAIEFVDPELRGPGLAELFKHASADEVQKVTRPSVQYLVPVEHARAAGLLDEAAPRDVPADEVAQFVQPVGVEAPADGTFTDLATGEDGAPLVSGEEVVITGPPADHTGVTENDPSGDSPLPTGDFAPAVESTTEAPAADEASQPSEPVTVADAPAAEEPAPAKTYDDGQPDMDWKRDAIDAYAGKLTPPLDTTSEPNKPSAIQAIKDAIAAGATAP